MKMLKCSLFFLIILNYLGYSQKNKQENFKLVFYNVEKLYDIIDDPVTNDDAYTPDGDKKWNEKRYNKKIEDLAKVIFSIDNSLPDIIGLAEIENKKVLKDLIANPQIQPALYQIAHFDSPDPSGLDVALIYKKNSFKVISKKIFAVEFSFDPESEIRNILYLKGIALNNDTLHIFVNHWKSRKGNDDGKKRDHSAKIVENAIDSILDINKKSKIIVMGDFNDEPTDDSIFEKLNANNKRKNTGKSELYNLFYDMHNIKNEGTFSRKGKWYMFDQIMVSQELVDTKEGLYVEYDAGKIFKPEWLLVRNPKINEMVPDKTYGGDTYLGGISDHLPVYVILKMK